MSWHLMECPTNLHAHFSGFLRTNKLFQQNHGQKTIVPPQILIFLQISNVKHLHDPPDLRNSETFVSTISILRLLSATFSSADAL